MINRVSHDTAPLDESSNQDRNRPLLLNGFVAELPSELDVLVRPMPDPSEVKAERERLDAYWFVHWFGGELFCLRLKAGGPNVEGFATFRG